MFQEEATAFGKRPNYKGESGAPAAVSSSPPQAPPLHILSSPTIRVGAQLPTSRLMGDPGWGHHCSHLPTALAQRCLL